MDGEDNGHVLQGVAAVHTKAETNGGTKDSKQQIQEDKDARSNIGSVAVEYAWHEGDEESAGCADPEVEQGQGDSSAALLVEACGREQMDGGDGWPSRGTEGAKHRGRLLWKMGDARAGGCEGEVACGVRCEKGAAKTAVRSAGSVVGVCPGLHAEAKGGGAKAEQHRAHGGAQGISDHAQGVPGLGEDGVGGTWHEVDRGQDRATAARPGK